MGEIPRMLKRVILESLVVRRLWCRYATAHKLLVWPEVLFTRACQFLSSVNRLFDMVENTPVGCLYGPPMTHVLVWTSLMNIDGIRGLSPLVTCSEPLIPTKGQEHPFSLTWDRVLDFRRPVNEMWIIQRGEGGGEWNEFAQRMLKCPWGGTAIVAVPQEEREWLMRLDEELNVGILEGWVAFRGKKTKGGWGEGLLQVPREYSGEKHEYTWYLLYWKLGPIDCDWVKYIQSLSVIARRGGGSWFMLPKEFDCSPRHDRVGWTMKTLAVLEEERKMILQGAKNELAMGANLNATIALLDYVDLTWVRRVMAARKIAHPDVLEEGTYAYVGLFLDHGVMYAGELGRKTRRGVVQIRKPVTRYYEHVSGAKSVYNMWGKRGGHPVGLYPAMNKLGPHKFILIPVEKVLPQWRLQIEAMWARFCHWVYNKTVGRQGRWRCVKLHKLSNVQKWKGKAPMEKAQHIIRALRVNVSSASLLRLLLDAWGVLTKDMISMPNCFIKKLLL